VLCSIYHTWYTILATARKVNLAARAAALTVWCSEREAEFSAGKPVDMIAYSAAITALTGMLTAPRYGSKSGAA
ncbi:MAG: hypothetical protein ABJ354_18930, partial [Nitratireductor sp.]